MIRVFFGVPESYGNSYWALMGHTGKERKAPKVGRTPPHGLVRIGLGRGGVPPAPVYKGARSVAAGLGGGRAKGGVLLTLLE